MKKLLFVLLLLGYVLPLITHSSPHSIVTSNQVENQDFDDDDLPEFVNF